MRSRSTLFALAALAMSAAPAAAAAATPDPAGPSARDAIWSLEQTIYAARGRGDAGPYLAAASDAYVSWPPGFGAPLHRSALVLDPAHKLGDKEKLAMTFMDFTVSGDVAVIYYRTHRTVRPDGAPTDERFDVTHTWIRQGGDWKVIGGMARLSPAVTR